MGQVMPKWDVESVADGQARRLEMPSRFRNRRRYTEKGQGVLHPGTAMVDWLKDD
jgi:hypothetical protein